MEYVVVGRETETSHRQKDFFGRMFVFNFADVYSRCNKGGVPNVKPKCRSSVKSKSKEVSFETSLMQHLGHRIQSHTTEEMWKEHFYQQG